MDRWNKIIAKKLAKVSNNESFQLYQENINDNSKYLLMFKLAGGHYKDQLHILSIDLKCDNSKTMDIGQWFPARAPKTKFITKMFHTNVSPQNGWICLDILNSEWSAMYNIDGLIENIVLLLDDPAPSGNHLNGEAAQLQQSCQKTFNEKSKKMKQQHGPEFSKLYNECFFEFDKKCSEKYNENKKMIIKCLPYFPRFAKDIEALKNKN